MYESGGGGKRGREATDPIAKGMNEWGDVWRGRERLLHLHHENLKVKRVVWGIIRVLPLWLYRRGSCRGEA